MSMTAGMVFGHAWTAPETAWWWIGTLTLLSSVLWVLSGTYVGRTALRPRPLEQALVRRGVVVRWPCPTLGELLVERYRLITVQQLAEALERQGEEGGRLGDIVVGMGFVSRDQVEAVLEDQRVAAPS
jgi:hypothetical protein